MDEIGFHVFDVEGMPWAHPSEYRYEEVVGRLDLVPEADVRMKHLVKSDEAKDRMPVTIVRFPPNFRFPRHWHTHDEQRRAPRSPGHGPRRTNGLDSTLGLR
jgi:hypothetical protein